MPERKTLERARKAKREGKAPTTQAGEFVREEMEHIREGKHGARSTKQAIAIGLSKARRTDVKLKPPKKGAGVGAHTQERGPRGLADGRPRNLRQRRIEPQHMRRRKTPAEQVGAWRFTCSPIVRCHRQEAADELNSSRMCVYSRARVNSDGRGSEPADTDSTSTNR